MKKVQAERLKEMKRLNSSNNTVKREMKINGIEKRKHGFSLRKYPEIEKLNLGETIGIKYPDLRSF